METPYDNVFKRLFAYHRFSSASKMFVKTELIILRHEWEDWFVGSVKAKYLKKQSSHLLNEQCVMVKFWITTRKMFIYAIIK